MTALKKFLINLYERILNLIYYQRALVYSHDLDNYNKVVEAKIPLVISHASVDEIKKLHQNPEMDLKVFSWDYLRKKIETGTWKCLVAKYEDKVIGYTFYSKDELPIWGTKKIEFALPPDAAYGFRSFVLSEYRNLSIAKQLHHVKMEILKKQEIKIKFAGADSTNKAMRNIIEKQQEGICIGSVTFMLTKFFNKVFISKGIYNAGLTIKRIYEE